MTDAQTTAHEAAIPEGPEAEAAIAAMEEVRETAYAALRKAWPAFVTDFQNGGPHPLRAVALLGARLQWIITRAWIETEGKVAPADQFFEIGKNCLIDFSNALQAVAQLEAERQSETLQ
jgi:hypothetical protein